MTNAKFDKDTQRHPEDLLDVLLDKDNRDPITLMDDNGKTMDFEQVCVIPYDVKGKDRKLYVVLKPIDHIDGVADDEAIVFRADFDKNGNTVLALEEDESVAIDVFNLYYDLLEAEQKAEGGHKGGKK